VYRSCQLLQKSVIAYDVLWLPGISQQLVDQLGPDLPGVSIGLCKVSPVIMIVDSDRLINPHPGKS
jgi:hypothetical protein